MDPVPGDSNTPTIVDVGTTGPFPGVATLPQLNPTKGDERRRMLLPEADLLKDLGTKTDTLKTRVVGSRLAEHLNQEVRRRKASGIPFPLDETSPTFGEAEGSQTRELRGWQSSTAPKSINGVGNHDALASGFGLQLITRKACLQHFTILTRKLWIQISQVFPSTSKFQHSAFIHGLIFSAKVVDK
ncbi:hypothetical protein IFR05_012798 [Cadophora sp. M221]|nr:hypothetical protein IFR05_012798 [Cadophora sp. M221]